MKYLNELFIQALNPRQLQIEGSQRAILVLLLFSASLLLACSPRVEIAPPNEPITINLNVKIDHEVKVKVEKDLEKKVFSEEAGLF